MKSRCNTCIYGKEDQYQECSFGGDCLEGIDNNRSAYIKKYNSPEEKLLEDTKGNDPINPNHYKSHPSGVECIQVTEHMNFNLGNALKYIWRADLKNDAIEDLKKAVWYVQRELSRREK